MERTLKALPLRASLFTEQIVTSYIAWWRNISSCHKYASLSSVCVQDYCLGSIMGQLKDNFPFGKYLSFAPLIQYWEEIASSDSEMRSRVVRDLLVMIEERPELTQRISDVTVLTQHKELIGEMMQLILPWSLGTDTHVSVIPPFTMETVFASPEFRRLDLMGALHKQIIDGGEMMAIGKAMTAYHHVLAELYEIENDWTYAGLVTVTDGETGLDRSV